MPTSDQSVNAAAPPIRRRYAAIHDLDLRTRQMIEETAQEEIELFRAWGDPAAIERLAEAGRIGDWGADEGVALAWQVSDVLEEIAARLRASRAHEAPHQPPSRADPIREWR